MIHLPGNSGIFLLRVDESFISSCHCWLYLVYTWPDKCILHNLLLNPDNISWKKQTSKKVYLSNVILTISIYIDRLLITSVLYVMHHLLCPIMTKDLLVSRSVMLPKHFNTVNAGHCCDAWLVHYSIVLTWVHPPNLKCLFCDVISSFLGLIVIEL